MADDNKKIILGLIVRGQVITKNRYPEKNGMPERYGIDVAVPGCRELLSIRLDPVTFGSVTEMDVFQGRVTMSTFKGRVYFEAVQ